MNKNTAQEQPAKLPTLTKQHNHNVAEHRGKMVIRGNGAKFSSYKMVTVHPQRISIGASASKAQLNKFLPSLLLLASRPLCLLLAFYI